MLNVELSVIFKKRMAGPCSCVIRGSVGGVRHLKPSRIKYRGLMQALSSGLCGKCLGVRRRVRRMDQERGSLNYYIPKVGGGQTGQCPEQRQETFIIEEPTLRSLLSLEHRVLTFFPQGKSVRRGRPCVD